MNKLASFALGAALIAGVTTLAAPASAGVAVGIGVGVGYPGYYYGAPRYRYYRYCDPYSPYFDPYYCDDPYYDAYYGPAFANIIYFDGGWWRGPFRHRYWHGHDWYWVNNGWHRNEWRGRIPSSIRFRNGGHFDNGRFGGFNRSHDFNRGDFRANWNGRSSGGAGDFRGDGGWHRGSFRGEDSWHGGGHRGH